jgi:hypothetical protein
MGFTYLHFFLLHRNAFPESTTTPETLRALDAPLFEDPQTSSDTLGTSDTLRSSDVA